MTSEDGQEVPNTEALAEVTTFSKINQEHSHNNNKHFAMLMIVMPRRSQRSRAPSSEPLGNAQSISA
jgi:hypothetical protein